MEKERHDLDDGGPKHEAVVERIGFLLPIVRPDRTWWLVGLLITAVIVAAARPDLWIHVAAPLLPSQRVERPEDGFAVVFPADWEYAVAFDADPVEWWDPELVDPVSGHSEFLADGGLMMARSRSSLEPLQWCEVYEYSGVASATPAWATIDDAEWSFRSWADDPANLAVECRYKDLRAGRTLAVQSRWQWDTIGQDQQDYIFHGAHEGAWFRLRCGTSERAPEDRWLVIAETFEFLPSA